MVYQERVGVIIMLTNLREGGREKCSRYWSKEGYEHGQHGNWVVESVGDGEEDEDEGAKAPGAGGGGFFAPEEKKEQNNSTLRRWIELSKKSDPAKGEEGERRRIRHIQYRAWPDFDIPAHPSEVVSLVKEVDEAQQAYLTSIGWEEGMGEEPPVLAHCSAGVGRTGVFIMVSSLLGLLREERRKSKAGVALMDMDVDVETPPAPPPPPPFLGRNRTISSGSTASSTSDTSSLVAVLSASTLDNSTTSSITTPSSSSLSSPAAPSTFDFSSPSVPPPPSTTIVKHPSSSLQKELAEPIPLLASDPIFSGVNSMREQRMSMVATHRQYVCVFECVLYGILQEIEQEENDRHLSRAV